MEYRMQSPVGARTIINDRERDYFAGCSYLGLQSHSAVRQAAIDALARYGLATATSRGGYGEHPIYDELDEELRATFAAERVLYYPSGYMNTIFLVQGQCEHYERIFVDASSHFSVLDGMQTSGKPVATFRHCDPEDLERQLRAELRPGERPLVLSDGVFPVSGEIAPAPDYLRLVEAYDGLLALDDAHASGVLGDNGRGTLEHWGISSPRARAAYTLSKAFGGYGGVVAGEAAWIDELDRNSRVYVASSPPPLPVAAAAAKALHLARTCPEIRQSLRANVARARAGFRKLGWPLADTPVPILCLGVRPGVDLAAIQQGLFTRDICVAHSRSYTSVPEGGALRVAIFATHTREQIDRLLAATAELL